MKEGWVKKKLGEVIEVAPSKKVQQNLNLSDTSSVSFLPMEDLSIDVKQITPIKIKQYTEVKGSYTFFREGDILLAKVTPCFENGKLGIATKLKNKVGFGSSELIVLHNSQGIVSSGYVYYYVQLDSFRKEGRKVMTGACGLKRLPKTYVSSYDIYFPKKMSEQQRIIEKLDTGFAKIEQIKANAEKNLRQAKDLFQATLRECITEKVGWTKHKLSEIYDVRDGTHDSPKYQEDGFPLVTSKNLKDGALDLTKVKFISREDFEAINKRSKVDVGDVLFAMIGTIGNPVQVIAPANYAIKNMALFKVPKNQSSRYLYYLLSSKMVLEKMSKDSKGTTQKFVSLGYLRQFIIRLPNSLAEQHKIVDKLDKLSDICKKLEDNYNRILTECDALKQALLRKAFNGEM